MKKIQVLGTGCPKCKVLAQNAQTAIDEIGGGFEIEKITDINEIMNFGVMITPALVIDGEVKVVGKIASPSEIKEMLG